MDVMGGMGSLRHDGEQFLGAVLGVTGHKAEDVVPLDTVDFPQQFGEVPRLSVGADGIFDGVAVDVLTQQRDVLVARRDEFLRLGENAGSVAAAFPSPDVGDNAVGAEVVAAVHDGQPCLESPVPSYRKVFADGVVVLREFKHPLAARERAIEQLRKAGYDVRAEDEIHMGIARADFVGDGLLLHHTAAQGNDELGVAVFDGLKRADVAEHPVLGVFPHGAGVEENEVRLFGVVGEVKAHLRQHTVDALPVRHIALTAVGMGKR